MRIANNSFPASGALADERAGVASATKATQKRAPAPEPQRRPFWPRPPQWDDRDDDEPDWDWGFGGDDDDDDEDDFDWSDWARRNRRPAQPPADVDRPVAGSEDPETPTPTESAAPEPPAEEEEEETPEPPAETAAPEEPAEGEPEEGEPEESENPPNDPSATECVPVGEDDTWDYVVIGAGAGGIPVADRLSEAGHKVLLLEKGPVSTARWGGSLKPDWLEGEDLTRFDVPGLCNQIWHDSTGIVCSDMDQFAGCILGGGTAINAGLWWRVSISFPPQSWMAILPVSCFVV